MELHEAGSSEEAAEVRVQRLGAAHRPTPACCPSIHSTSCRRGACPQARLQLVQALEGSPAAKQVQVLFDLWDTDGDGRISVEGGQRA
jgi:hypothetical protein